MPGAGEGAPGAALRRERGSGKSLEPKSEAPQGEGGAQQDGGSASAALPTVPE